MRHVLQQIVPVRHVMPLIHKYVCILFDILMLSSAYRNIFSSNEDESISVALWYIQLWNLL